MTQHKAKAGQRSFRPLSHEVLYHKDIGFPRN